MSRPAGSSARGSGGRPGESVEAVLEFSPGWPAELLQLRIGGLTLLERHLRALEQLGCGRVWLSGIEDTARLRAALGEAGTGLDVVVAEVAENVLHPPRIRLRADTVFDRRLLRRLTSAGSAGAGRIVVVDSQPEGHTAAARSPYLVGVPDNDEGELLSEAEWRASDGPSAPIGLQMENGPGATLVLDAGRFYWHRIQSPADARVAEDKVLLATVKPTDGIYARTNRRASLPISRQLLRTPVTPNQVTIATFFGSLGAGLLFAAGSYPYMVAGAFVSWFSSMLDGVDGELARASFRESDFGCWLEMVCDYLYYVFVFTGIGVGLYRSSGNVLWFWAGVFSVVGVLLSFFVVAVQRRRFAQEGDDAANYGLAFQKRMEARQHHSPLARFLRTCNFLATRAALPYYILAFTLLGAIKLLMSLILVGTTLAWLLTSLVTGLFGPRRRGGIKDAAPASGRPYGSP